MTWCLPVALIFLPSASGGGWYAAILFIISPVIVGGAGLLGSWPRFRLRRAGHRSAPAEVCWLLILHWWAWAAVILTFTDVSDVSDVPSLLQTAFPGPMSYESVSGIRLAALVVLVSTWLAVMARVITDAPFTRHRPWTTLTKVTAFAAPGLLAVGVALAAILGASQQDAAGERPADVANRSTDDQQENYESRYSQLQESLVPVREAISQGGWQSSASLRTQDADDSRSGVDQYSFSLRHSIDEALDDDEMERLTGTLQEDGWEPAPSSVTPVTKYEHPDGAQLRFRIADDTTSLTITSPTWWGDPWDWREPGEEEEPLTVEDLEELEQEQAQDDPVYTAEEWPEAP